jgi:hypothetical protein
MPSRVDRNRAQELSTRSRCLRSRRGSPPRLRSAAAASQPAGEIGPGDGQVVQQRRDRSSRFDHGQIRSRDVLDQRELERDDTVDSHINERRDRDQLGQPSGAPAPLPCDEVVMGNCP